MEQRGPVQLCGGRVVAHGLVSGDVQHVVQRALFAQFEDHAQSGLDDQAVEEDDVLGLQHTHYIEFFAQVADLLFARELFAGFE